MTRLEKASEPSMDEILASIRRIIAEEPVGSRPLPTSARVAAPLPAAQPAPTAVQQASSAVAPASAPAPAAMSQQPAAAAHTVAAAPRREPMTPSPQPAVDPIAAAMAAPARSPLAAAPAQRAPVPRDPPLPVEPPLAAPSRSESPFGRIAEALGSERRAGDLSRAVEPSLPPIARGGEAPAAAPVATAPRAAASDLDDLLADPPLPPFGSLGAPSLGAPEPSLADRAPTLEAAPAASVVADEASRLETSGGRVFARRSIDLGTIVPMREDEAPATLVPAAAAPQPASTAAPAALTSEPDKTGQAKPTAQARAMDKMLTARIAAAKVAPPPEPLPAAPVVIAAMPEVREPETAAAPEQPAAMLADDLDDLIETDDAKSALGMLAAGLAASPPSPQPTVPPAAEPVAADADDVPTMIVMPAAVAAAEAEPAAPAAARSEPPAPPPSPSNKPAEARPAAPEKKLLAEALPARIVSAPAAAAPPPAAATTEAAPRAAVAQPSPQRPAVSTAAPLLPSLMAMVPQPAAPAAAAVPTPAAPAPAAPVSAASNIAPLERQTVGVRTIEDMVAELLRPMLREWLAENMPRIVEKALRIELAEGLKTVDHIPRKVAEK